MYCYNYNCYYNCYCYCYCYPCVATTCDLEINLTYFFRLSLTAHSLTTHDHRFNSQKFALIESYTHDHRS